MGRKFVLQWHLTHLCNLKCTHCYQEDYTQSFDMEQCKKVLTQFRTFCDYYGFHGHINFTGGEPLICDFFFDLLSEAEGMGFTFGVLTNGTLITPEIADRLSTFSKLSFVQISIDGKKKTHDAIRGTGSFKKSFEGIKLLKKSGIQTMVSFTCHKKNHKEIKSLIRYCRHHWVDRFWTDRLIPFGSNTEEIIDTDDYRKVIEILTDESRKPGMTVHTNRALQWCGGGNEFYHCGAGESLLVILADGTLLPCRRLPLEVGNVLSEDMLSLYQKSEIIRELNEQKIPDECSCCLQADRCRGGAKCLSYAVKGRYDVRDINCYIL